MTGFPLRSWLYVPGHDAHRHGRAAEAGADVVVLDLEDGTPADLKDSARKAAAATLADVDFGQSRRFVRINAVETGRWRGDLDAVLPHRPDGIVLAKASDPTEIAAVAAVVRSVDPAPILAPIVTEDVAGVFALERTVVADESIAAVVWGTEDLSASLGAWTVKDGDGLLDPFRIVRSLVLLHAARHGLPAIDTPYVAIRDLDGLRAEALLAARSGFAGKQAIHPTHVGPINEAFIPGDRLVSEARELVAAFEADGAAVVRVDDTMADAPHLRRARSILALHEAVTTGAAR